MMIHVAGLGAIVPGQISVRDYMAASNADQVTAKAALIELVRRGIGSMQGGAFEFSAGDKLEAAIEALREGADIDEVSERLDWRDFEGLAARVLEEKGFDVRNNVMMTNPRAEIDVMAENDHIAISIDCKHWKRAPASALAQAAKKQSERTARYVSEGNARAAVPAIVTLYQNSTSFAGRVPIVPIHQLAEFVDELYGRIEELQVIKRDS